MIRQVEETDIRMIANIHKENFGDHFLGQFSERLIAKFYKCFVGERNFIVSYNQKNDCQGFILGGSSNTIRDLRILFVKKHWIHFAIEILFMPKIWGATIKRIKPFAEGLKMSKSKKPTKSAMTSPDYTLLSIAVGKKHQRQGVASILMQEFEQRCNMPIYGLSVYNDNKKAIAFYKKIGMTQYSQSEDSISFRKHI